MSKKEIKELKELLGLEAAAMKGQRRRKEETKGERTVISGGICPECKKSRGEYHKKGCNYDLL